MHGPPGHSSRKSTHSKYEKYFLISDASQSDQKNFYRQFMAKKLYILYSLYLQRQKLNEESKKDFFDYVVRFLNIPKETTNEKNKNDQGSSTESTSNTAGQALCDTLPK